MSELSGPDDGVVSTALAGDTSPSSQDYTDAAGAFSPASTGAFSDAAPAAVPSASLGEPMVSPTGEKHVNGTASPTSSGALDPTSRTAFPSEPLEEPRVSQKADEPAIGLASPVSSDTVDATTRAAVPSLLEPALISPGVEKRAASVASPTSSDSMDEAAPEAFLSAAPSTVASSPQTRSVLSPSSVEPLASKALPPGAEYPDIAPAPDVISDAAPGLGVISKGGPGSDVTADAAPMTDVTTDAVVEPDNIINAASEPDVIVDATAGPDDIADVSPEPVVAEAASEPDVIIDASAEPDDITEAAAGPNVTTGVKEMAAAADSDAVDDVDDFGPMGDFASGDADISNGVETAPDEQDWDDSQFATAAAPTTEDAIPTTQVIPPETPEPPARPLDEFFGALQEAYPTEYNCKFDGADPATREKPLVTTATSLDEIAKLFADPSERAQVESLALHLRRLGRERVELLVPNAALENSSAAWVQCWQMLFLRSIRADSMASRFQWRRSVFRKTLYTSLGLTPPAMDGPAGDHADGDGSGGAPKGVATPPRTSSLGGQSRPLDRVASPTLTAAEMLSDDGAIPASTAVPAAANRELNVEYSKSLCAIPAGKSKLAGMSVDALAELLSEIRGQTAKARSRLDTLLDAKEQLLVDTEMHNKLIASLVQFAQQQAQTRAKGGGGGGGRGGK